MQLGAITMWLIFITLTFGISIGTDLPDCKEVQCPLVETIKCPPDSNARIIQPHLVVANGSETSNVNNSSQTNLRRRRDLAAEAVNITTDTPTTDGVPTVQPTTEDAAATHGLDVATNSVDLPPVSQDVPERNLTEQCCPRAECVCNEICHIPSCFNASLVLIETKPRSNIPGECCAEYTCGFEPNCAQVINTNGSWLIDCQVCECVAGQRICHRSCDEIRPGPANCLSQTLKRSFSNGESWKEDECTTCECVSGEKKCLTSFCKALNCPNKVKLTGECCPMCVDVEPVPEVVSTSSPTTPLPTITEGVSPVVPPCANQDERIIHVVESKNENCILYAIIAFLALIAMIFIGLYYHERSKQRSYRPVPVFDSNFNKIKSNISS